MSEFDEPTEPMSQVFLPPYLAPTFQTGTPNDRNIIPAPQMDERPFPKSGVNPIEVSRTPATPPMYPVLPPAHPESRNSRPPGGAPPYAHPGKPDAFVRRQPRRNSFPALVGMFFLTVELLLLLRLLFFLFGAPSSNVWVAFVYTVSTFFLLPFFFLLENVKIPLLSGTELYSDLLIICAILLYGLLSRILVRFFKALLNSR
jgi:hypothetical protein